ncbi:MAG: biotin/lipoyl-containing protein [Bacteroidota bacterium]
MENNNFVLTVNSKFTHHIESEYLNDLDLIEVDKGKYHLIKDGASYEVEIIDVDLAKKQVRLKIGHEKFETVVADINDQLIEKMGLEMNIAQQVNDIKAPMPGMVISILTEVGKTIEQGEPLLVLEAMKMENVLKSPGDGVIKSILTKTGQAVDKGDILIEME